MSKYVKNLITEELRSRLQGVDDALVVNLIGLDANQTVALRRDLRGRDIEIMVVKNSLAKRATEGTPLSAAFERAEGSLALVWGSEDFISLAKQITALNDDDSFKAFETRGGVMDGEHLSADRVKEISKWPNREEQLSILVGQILSPGADLAAQLEAPGGLLASQIEKIADGEAGGGGDPAAEGEAAEGDAAPAAE